MNLGEQKNPLVFALYLPQFYQTDYNDEWWGVGYTDWIACKKSKKLFKSHNQPRVPLGKNYYDLSQKETIFSQAELAKKYNIDGFAIYQYYSCGRTLLEKPLEIIKNNHDIDINYYLYWANESWRKAWFGQDETIIWKQEYGDELEWKKQFEYCLEFFEDDRYLKIDNKPVYAIYHPGDFTNVNKFISLWNNLAIQHGFNGIYFVKTLGRRDSNDLENFDAVVSREPNYTFAKDEKFFEKLVRVVSSRSKKYLNNLILNKFDYGMIMQKTSYDSIWKKIVNRSYNETNFIGAFCDWDNSPRKGYNSIIMYGTSIKKFEKYFEILYKKAIKGKSKMIVINAWNEWAEGAYLEPDEKNKFGYLNVIKNIKEKYMVKNEI